jgi:sporulation protein YlmC with PRC-barrel domain
MAKDRVYQTEDGVRIAPLSALDDFEVAEGYPDIRGWRVDSADGQHVGKVHDLLIDVDNMRTRYLDVRLTKEVAASPGDRDVLVPVGTAQVIDGKDVVRVPLTAERFGLLPLYDHGRLSRTHELEVRRHFSLGEAAAATATGAAAGAASRSFYDDDGYDDRRFFGARRSPRTDAEIAARRVDSERELATRERADRDLVARERADRDLVNRDLADRDLVDRDLADRDLVDRDLAHRDRVRRADAERDVPTREEEIRVPVDQGDAVLLKRGDDGRDEIIIRRPLGTRDERRR